MVIKGGSRGGPGDLAEHLQRLDTNERMEVKELRGVAADQLLDALREMDAVASGTRCTRPLYHVSINTRADEVLTPEQWNQAIDALEARMNLTDQPRAVVLHEKEGREHVHVVWSRIDLDRMRAISDSHNYRRHEEVARTLEQEFGHARVQGAHVGREGGRPERTPSHAEMQQAERTGLTPQEAKEQITALWQQTDSGQAFAAALEDRGWILVRGDRRDFVVIDPHGETHSLAKRIEGAKAKDVRARMAGIDAAKLPSVEEAREMRRATHQVARKEGRDTAAPPTRGMRQVPQEIERELPTPSSPELRPTERLATPAPTTPEPDRTVPRGAAAARGGAAAEGRAAQSPLAPETSIPVAKRGLRGVQAAGQDRRSARTASDQGASTSITAPVVTATRPRPDIAIRSPAAKGARLAGGLARGASKVLDAGAKLAEDVIGFLDGLFGGASSANPNEKSQAAEPRPIPTPSREPQSDTMTHEQRISAVADAVAVMGTANKQTASPTRETPEGREAIREREERERDRLR